MHINVVVVEITQIKGLGGGGCRCCGMVRDGGGLYLHSEIVNHQDIGLKSKENCSLSCKVLTWMGCAICSVVGWIHPPPPMKGGKPWKIVSDLAYNV